MEHIYASKIRNKIIFKVVTAKQKAEITCKCSNTPRGKDEVMKLTQYNMTTRITWWEAKIPSQGS